MESPVRKIISFLSFQGSRHNMKKVPFFGRQTQNAHVKANDDSSRTVLTAEGVSHLNLLNCNLFPRFSSQPGASESDTTYLITIRARLAALAGAEEDA